EEMEPLFRAVYHGCAAGKHQETFGNVYWKRIERGENYYNIRQLGAFGSDLGAVACFFEKYWDRPAAGLSEQRKALVLNFAGFCLRAVGRLREATEPTEVSLELYIGQEKWEFAAIVAGNLSELYLTLGEVEKAVEYGRRGVEYADKSGNEFERMGKRTTLADALFQAGEIEEAKGLFGEAEEMQKERQPEYGYLYSLQGYKYCDLLLALGEYEEVKERIKKCFEWRLPSDSLLGIALEDLSLGKAWLAEAASKTKEQKSNIKIAEKYLNEAVDGLRKAGQQDDLPRGLLARAGCYRVAAKWGKGKTGSPTEEPKEQQSRTRARGDLEEAREIAERGEMKLFQADYHLESARVCLAQAEDRSQKTEVRISKEKEGGKNAKWHYEEAKRLIGSCGYRRRDEELKDIEGRTPKRGK
ncbi:unnamed protein product, partial [marine sediment metagenome]